MKDNTICGHCKYHRTDRDGDWYCANPDSDYYTDWTEYNDGCEDGEERNG